MKITLLPYYLLLKTLFFGFKHVFLVLTLLPTLLLTLLLYEITQPHPPTNKRGANVCRANTPAIRRPDGIHGHRLSNFL